MKFTIRDLFLVTVIVAVCLAWWLDHRRQWMRIQSLETVEYKSRFVKLPTPQAPAPIPPKD